MRRKLSRSGTSRRSLLVVCARAVWTAAEGMTDLVALIDPADPLRAQFASVDVYVFAINDAGAIVGNMGVPGSSTNSRAFVLVPQP